MVAGAGWGESTWDGDEDDLLGLEFLGGVVGDGNTADPGGSIVSIDVVGGDGDKTYLVSALVHGMYLNLTVRKCQFTSVCSGGIRHANVPPSGKLSPALSPACPVMMSVMSLSGSVVKSVVCG